MSRVLLDPAALRPAELVPPPSKSDAQRALVLAHALGIALPVLDGQGALPDDVAIVADALARFGASPGEAIEVNCRDGGAPLRLLLGQAALRSGAVTRFVGSPRLGARPHLALISALRTGLGACGLEITVGDPWPIVVRGATTTTTTTTFRVAAEESSQPLSSLLLLGVALARREGRGCVVEASTAIASPGYLELTLSWMRRAGVRCTRAGSRFEIEVPAAIDGAGLPAVPSDWSSIAYLLIAAWASGGWVRGVDVAAAHPDRAIVVVLRSIGLTVEPRPDRTEVRGTPRAGLDLSAREAPDLIPTLAALACVLPTASWLRDVEILRVKESDRLRGVQDLVALVGGEARLEGGSLRVTPPPASHVPVEPLELDARGDHRMAMSAATLALLTRRRIAIDGAEHVSKSFPGFWQALAAIGARIE